MSKFKNIFGRISEIAPGTWVRLALLIAALVNISVKLLGGNPGDSESFENVTTVIIMVVTALAAYWKNNSFTEAAIAADEIMKSLKK